MDFDVVAMLNNVSAAGVNIRSLLSGLGVLMGICFLAHAGRLLVKHASTPGEREGAPWASVAAYLFLGAALARFSLTVDDVRTGLLAGVGSEVRQAMSYGVVSGGGSGGIWPLLMSTCFIWVATIGLFAMVRGIYLWRKAASGDNQGGAGDYGWRGLWHLIFGAIAINIGTN